MAIVLSRESRAKTAAVMAGATRPVRHGLARLTLRIGGTDYRLRPSPVPPPGFLAVWTLRNLGPERAGAVYSVAQFKGEGPGCTCPDHEHNGAICKHIMALRALGLLPKPKERKTNKARGPRLHEKNARAAIAEANRPAEARIPAPWFPPAPKPAPVSPVNSRVPEGWQPGGQFAAGFHQAVASRARQIQGGAEICEGCGREYDLDESRDPHFCSVCMEGGDA